MEWSISQVDFPPGIDPDETVILLGIDAGLDGDYGRTYLVEHDGALKALHRGGMVGSFRVAELSATHPPRIEEGKWGGEQLVLNLGPEGEKRLNVTHHERDATLEVLEKIYRAHEPGPELAALLELRVATTHDDEIRIAALEELATLYTDVLNTPARAVVHLRACLKLRPDDAVALETLGRLAAMGSVDACDTLEGACRELRRHADLAKVLLVRADIEQDRERLSHQLDAARLLEDEVGSPGQALDVILTALAENPDNHDVLERADTLADKANAWSRAARGFRAAERATEDPLLDAKLLWRIGEAHQKAGEIEEATQAMQELTWLDPNHRDALARLEALFGEGERFKPQLEVLERLLAISDDDRERVTWLRRMADTLEIHLHDIDGAVAQNLEILTLSDHDDAALAALVRLYEATQRWDDVVAMLDRRAERAAVNLRSELLARAAAITEERLSDEATAMRRWRGALTALPTNEAAMDAVTRLFTEHERWLELVNALEQHAIGVAPSRAVASLQRAALICHDKLQQGDRATSCYERAREIQPDDVAVLEALRVAYRERVAPEPLLAVLTELLRLDTAERRLELLTERADTRHRAGDLDGAIDDLQSALPLVEKGGSDHVHLLLLKGDIEGQKDEQLALTSYRSALTVQPSSREAFDRLEPLLRAQDDVSALADLYERRAQVAPDERDSWLCRAAKLRAEGDPQRACKLVLQAHATSWQDEGVAAALCALGTHPAVWRDVLDELEARLDGIAAGQRRRYGRAIDRFVEACRATVELDKDEVLLRAAQHYDRARRAPKRALKLYQRAFRRNRTSSELDFRIRALLEHLERHTELIEHLKETLDQNVYEGDDRRDLLEKLADTLVAADRIEEAEEIRRQLSRRTTIAMATTLVFATLAVLLYFLLFASPS